MKIEIEVETDAEAMGDEELRDIEYSVESTLEQWGHTAFGVNARIVGEVK
jgi:hypothetical protein